MFRFNYLNKTILIKPVIAITLVFRIDFRISILKSLNNLCLQC